MLLVKWLNLPLNLLLNQSEKTEITVVTHRATEAHLAATVEKLSKSEVVREVESVIRVEGSAS